MNPARLSRQLRTSDDDYLRRRRSVLLCALGAAASMGIISLYQMGVIRHLPEPPLPLLDADEVDAAPQAYARFSTPDGVLGFASYGGTMLLAAIGAPDRVDRRPWLPIALAAKTTLDAAQAAKLTVDQWTHHRAFCSWCLAAATLSFLSFKQAMPEARAAVEAIRARI